MLARVDPVEAERILVDAPASLRAELVAWLGDEGSVLRWAAALARTLGWPALAVRLPRWKLPTGTLPWGDEVAAALAKLSRGEAALLRALAACDVPFGWEVLENVAPDANVDDVIALENAGLLRRETSAGVVTFLVPFSVRAATEREASMAARWLDAWTERARAIRGASYGFDARATLAELATAIPLAAHALAAADATRGLALWLAAADALFFGDAPLPYDAPVFNRAVEVADETGDAEARAHARIVAGRALLERGDAAGATALLRAAAPTDPILRAEAERGIGWAALALTTFAEARAAFEAARTVDDPRTQADATAGLGIHALLTGDPSRARGLLEESLAIHVVMRDAPREAAVRGMMELLPSADAGDTVSSLLADVDRFRTSGQRWREALALARLALAARARGDASSERARLLEARAAAALAKVPAANVVRSMLEPTTKPIVIGNDGRTLALPNGDRHDLARHGPVRRILWALARARVERPGTAMPTLEVIEAGWPGEKMQHEAATLRVYTTIRRLRGFGLGDVLVTRDDGYLLDPDVPLTIG